MAGVIDEYGQWEHCNVCGKYVLIQNLGYLPPSNANKTHKAGADICLDCTNKLDYDDLVAVQPAESWIPQYEGDN